jgi:hypothetical protein
LLLVLAGAGDERFCLAWIDFFAWVWCVAWIGAAVLADSFFSSAGLGARCGRIFALAWSVTGLLAEMDPTFQLLAAGKAA